MNDARSTTSTSRARNTGPRRATPSCSCGRSGAPRTARSTAPSCSCTARRWPRSRPSICRCRAGRAHGLFRRRRASTPGRVDMEGYGRSDQGPRHRRHHLRGRRRPQGRDRLHLQDPQPHRPAAGVRHLVGRAARRAVRAAPSRTACKRLALDAHVWTGEGSPTLVERRKKLPEFLKTKRRPIDRKFVRSIFERDHPGTADDNVIEAFADAHPRARRFDPERHLHRHVQPPAGGRSDQDHGADHRHARRIRRHRRASRTCSSSSSRCPTRTSSSR